jgi:high affinity sulfate transporter 1
VAADQPLNAAPVPSGEVGGLARWAPGLHVLRHYRREWLAHDVGAGLALTAVLIPVGMGYAEASGVPAIHGLYATIVPLLIYAVLGPSRNMVLGPDSTLAAVIAALILPLAGGGTERAVALAGALALLTGGFQLLISFARLGLVADLFSKPIRLGFMNAIALTVIVGQLPKLLGFSVNADEFPERVQRLVQGVAAGKVNGVALAIGAGSLLLILALRRWRPGWPGVLLAVAGATLLSAGLGLEQRASIAVLGEMPRGLPLPDLPLVQWQDLRALVPGAAVIALLSFADTTVLSRALAAHGGYRVSQDQEMLAIGAANIGSGLFQGFSISSSASRTPVAEAAGSRTQLTGVVGALMIALLLFFAPALLHAMPSAVLAAVVITACLSFADVKGMLALYRQQSREFGLSLIAFLGVAFVGVIQGIAIAIALSMLVLVWNAWHPYSAVLARVDGRKGFHDLSRHPEGRTVPGLVIFRWDAPLFFANGQIFHARVLAAVEAAAASVRQVIVAADAISQVDVTAAEALATLERELRERGVELQFAGLKGPVKDSLARLGLADTFRPQQFSSTVGSAVDLYRSRFPVDWKDWDET